MEGGDIDTKIRLWVVQVDGGRDLTVIQSEQAGERLQRSGSAEQVASHRLGCGDDRLGVFTQ